MPALKKILCALDLSDQSESVAEYVMEYHIPSSI